MSSAWSRRRGSGPTVSAPAPSAGARGAVAPRNRSPHRAYNCWLGRCPAARRGHVAPGTADISRGSWCQNYFEKSRDVARTRAQVTQRTIVGWPISRAPHGAFSRHRRRMTSDPQGAKISIAIVASFPRGISATSPRDHWCSLPFPTLPTLPTPDHRRAIETTQTPHAYPRLPGQPLPTLTPQNYIPHRSAGETTAAHPDSVRLPCLPCLP